MTKEEIQNIIYKLDTEEKIRQFVETRLNELEENSVESTVGQNYTDTFQEYISQKTHYKAGASLEGFDCPDLVYDDIMPYIELIKSIQKLPWYNELTLFSTIFFVIYHYLPSDDVGLGRAFTYMGNKGKRISIKTIRENGCAFCSEKAGMAHNMFKFLGIDSEVACGYRNDDAHAFNMVYPNGYGNEPMVIYDPSHYVSFIKDNYEESFGYFKALRCSDYERLIQGERIKIDLAKTESNYRSLYRTALEGFTFVGDEPTYAIGLTRVPKAETPGL